MASGSSQARLDHSADGGNAGGQASSALQLELRPTADPASTIKATRGDGEMKASQEAQILRHLKAGRSLSSCGQL